MTERPGERNSKPVARCPGAIGPGATRALYAVMAGARNSRAVARRCGWQSHITAHDHLVTLRRAGLVAWEPGKPNTLRVLVRPVGPRR